MTPHSSILAWKIPWAGRLQSMGSWRVGQDWATSLSLFTFIHWRRKWQHSSVLAWRIPGTEEPGGLPSVGSYRVGHNWCDLAAARYCLNFIFPPFYWFAVEFFWKSFFFFKFLMTLFCQLLLIYGILLLFHPWNVFFSHSENIHSIVAF